MAGEGKGWGGGGVERRWRVEGSRVGASGGDPWERCRAVTSTCRWNPLLGAPPPSPLLLPSPSMALLIVTPPLGPADAPRKALLRCRRQHRLSEAELGEHLRQRLHERGLWHGQAHADRRQQVDLQEQGVPLPLLLLRLRRLPSLPQLRRCVGGRSTG